jgi:EAL domain-containing protein (putative c-di-GMP-specific phosphodiesterase class I)
VEGIHNFAKSINIETVAEFVSSEDIYKEVASICVDFSQGYYFGVPSPKLVEA